MKDLRTAVIGAGRLGKSIGFALRNAGYNIAAVSCRTMTAAKSAVEFIGSGMPFDDPVKTAMGAELILIATPDGVITETCAMLERNGAIKKNSVVLHFSGSLNSFALTDARLAGAMTGSIHPMASFARPEIAVKNMEGICWFYEGDEKIHAGLEKMAVDMKGVPLKIEADKKVLYHASAVTASNYMIPLMSSAFNLIKKAGISNEQAVKSLIRLAESTLQNLAQTPPGEALTGPIARGDLQTIKDHLTNMTKYSPEDLPLYTFMGLAALAIAENEKCLDTKQARKIEHLLADFMNRRPSQRKFHPDGR